MEQSSYSSNHCDIPPMESVLACSILSDLEKHLTLLKLASTKQYQGSSSSTTLPNKTTGDLLVKAKVTTEELHLPLLQGNTYFTENAVLEAKREYGKLCREFSKVNIEYSGTDSRNTFLQEVDYIIDVIHKTAESLNDLNNFFILSDEVEKASGFLNRETMLQSETDKVKERISKMKQELRKIEQEMSFQEQHKMAEINRLKDENHLTKVEGEEALKFTDLYFEAQSCTINCTHRDDMEEKTKDIHQTQRQIDRDIHCLSVMASWTDEFCEQIESKIGEWKLKFRRDEFAMEMRIDAKKKAIKNQEELIKSLNETIAERLEELAPWEEEKEVERQERLAHMRRYYSARKIQRWWRGYMMKLKLYKRKKVKPKAGS